MVDPLTAVTWAFSVGTAIAQSEPGKEFIKSTIGEVAKKATGAGIEKINTLRKFIIDKLRKDKPEALPALEKAEAGSVADLEEVADYLRMVMRQDVEFAEQLQTQVQNIQVEFDDINAENVQQIFGGQGLQVNAKQEQPIFQIQGNPTINLGKSDAD